MSRARIVRIITRLNVGGPAIQALLLTEHLDAARYESHLIAGRPGPREGSMVELRGSPVVPTYIPSLVRRVSPRHDLRAFVELVVLLRRLRPDVVHTHLAKAGLLGRIAARLSGTRAIVHTFHGNVLRGYFGPSLSRSFLYLERAVSGISHRIVSIGPRQTADLLSLGVAPRDKIVEIPLGFDLDPFLSSQRGELRRELGIRDDVPLVGTVARLVPIKGVDVFLRAARQVHLARPDARFVIVGDGELRPELERLAQELGLKPFVTFLGWRSALAPIYADLDVVVLTSHNEGTPVALIEAAAAGRPIVATSVGGVPDVAPSGSAALVPDGDDRSASTAILHVLEDETFAASLGAAARGHVYPRYDRSVLLARIDSLYRELLAH